MTNLNLKHQLNSVAYAMEFGEIVPVLIHGFTLTPSCDGRSIVYAGRTCTALNDFEIEHVHFAESELYSTPEECAAALVEEFRINMDEALKRLKSLGLEAKIMEVENG
jgi:hypothetical protein